MRKLQVDKQKRYGIEPDSMAPKTVAISYNVSMEVDEAVQDDPEVKKRACYDCFIISEDGWFYSLSTNLFMFACLCSSHFAFYLALMGNPDFDYRAYSPLNTDFIDIMFTIQWALEVFFFIYMCQGFVTEYTQAGFEPVRDVEQIASHYVYRGSFWWQWLAVLPL